MTMLSRRALLSLAAGASLALPALPAAAQSYPQRSLTMIVTYAAGGPADILARVLATPMAEFLGQNIVVDNKAGAGGVLGSELNARAAPDGYTFQMGAVSTHVIAKQLFGAKLPYDPQKSFTPIGQIIRQSNVFLVGNHVPVNNVAEFVAWAKKQPSVQYGTSGVGSSPHLVGAMVGEVYGIKMDMIPYRGSMPAMSDLMAGQIPAIVDNILGAKPFVDDKRMKAIALTGLERSPILPGVPTFNESGAPGFDLTSWQAFYGPAGLPQPIVAKLNAAMKHALAVPAVKQKLLELGCEPVGGSPEELAAFMEVELPKWSRLVTISGAKPE